MSDCGCEDYPCCGCGSEWTEFLYFEPEFADGGPWPTSVEAKSWLFDDPYREFEPEVDDV